MQIKFVVEQLPSSARPQDRTGTHLIIFVLGREINIVTPPVTAMMFWLNRCILFCSKRTSP